jgi:hypothetical protein
MRTTASMVAEHEREMRLLGRGADLEGQDFSLKFAAAEDAVRRAGIDPICLTETLASVSDQIALHAIETALGNQRRYTQPSPRFVVNGMGAIVRIGAL